MVPICTLFHSLLHRCITASYKCKLAGINLNPCGNPLILWEYLFILSCCSRPPKVWKRMLIILGNYRMVSYRCECYCCPGAQSEEYWYCYLQATGRTLVCFDATVLAYWACCQLVAGTCCVNWSLGLGMCCYCEQLKCGVTGKALTIDKLKTDVPKL